MELTGGRVGATELTNDPPGAVVITGCDRLFAAGADISQFGGSDEAATIGAAFHDALDAVAAIPRFVIGAVSGYALGGGCELALARDDRIGLADEVVAPETRTERALALAAEVAAGALTAQAICKRAIDGKLDGSLADGLDCERASFVEVFHTDDARTDVDIPRTRPRQGHLHRQVNLRAMSQPTACGGVAHRRTRLGSFRRRPLRASRRRPSTGR